MTTTEERIDDQVRALRLIASDRPTYVHRVHDAARRTRDENPLTVAQELGGYLGFPVNVETLCELAEHLAVTDDARFEDHADRRWHEMRVDGLTSKVLVGPAALRALPPVGAS